MAVSAVIPLPSGCMAAGVIGMQLTADKSGADVMKPPPHNINLPCAWPPAELHIFLPRRSTHSLLVLHDVIPPVLLGEVRRQHVKAPSKLGEHHVIGVACKSFIWMHKDFFLMAATPVVKVFLMLVARRKDSWETPSRPAMDPDSTVAPAARLPQQAPGLIRAHRPYLSNKHEHNPVSSDDEISPRVLWMTMSSREIDLHTEAASSVGMADA
ncbi:hypothetical protein EYF80_002971 [Liparis tanakae]|uniref:Uncharacterized protein n=1 Tax=Liparis tanakae TaxID=230148 RepID=A0A4Z2JAV1_9TELE|nr:hypothetical protein EYF80_002971 [Liparis tanakae]